MRSIILLFFLITSFEEVFAETLTLLEGEGEYEAFKYVEYFVDFEKRITSPEEIEDKGLWKPNNEDAAFVGHGKAPVWLKLVVKNRADDRKRWSIYFGSLLVKELKFFRGLRDLDPLLEGYSVNDKKQSVKSFANIFPLYLDKGETKTLYFKIVSHRGSIHSLISKPIKARTNFLMQMATCWAHLTILMLIGLITAVLYYNNSETPYLFFCGFSMTMILRALITSNLGNTIFHTSGIDFHNYLGFATTASAYMAVFFTLSFCRKSIYATKLDPLLKIVGIIGLVLGTLTVWPFHGQLIFFSYLYSFIAIVMIVAATAICYRSGYQPARYLLVGWGAFVLGLLYWGLSEMNILPYNYFTNHGPAVGNIFEMVFFFIALTERTRMAHLEEHEEKAKEKENADLGRLIRILVHDIRNPLSVIQGGATIGALKCSDPKQKELWLKILKAGGIIGEIINDVKSLESLQSGTVQVKLEPVSLKYIFEKAQFVFANRLKEKNLELIIEIADAAKDLFVRAEPISLSNNVINNLVSNAVKFSHKGGTVKIFAKEDRGEIMIQVSDEGIGIPDEIRQVIFDPETAISRAGTNKEKGTGFAMPLVKTYVENYGGRIRILSPQEKPTGTTIEIILAKDQPQFKAG